MLLDASDVSMRINIIFQRYHYVIPSERGQLIQLSCDLDNEFDIDTDPDEIAGLSTHADLVKLVHRELGNKVLT
jgi:hypothetical protein